MTAIAGLIRLDRADVDRDTLERMRNVLEPYGRDAQHIHVQPGAGFVRTLLRTTPEDSLDRQPVPHRESRNLVLFDGRLDNREELAEALDISGEELRLMADSAVVMHACLRWDTAAVNRLLGDYAIAYWQPRSRRLWLARDPLGNRPLYWNHCAKSFAFATLAKALFAIPGVEQDICEERLHDYLCLLPMVGPESFFKGIYRVEPGQIVILQDETRSAERYHRWDCGRELRLATDNEYLEAFREQLGRAVACRLRAAGPIASELSSGFDSSTVTAVAARQLAARGERLIAYTAVPREGFEGPAPRGWHSDEGPGASAVVAHFPNIEHHLIRTSGTSPLDGLWEAVQVADRPPLNPCNMVWSNAILAAAARRGAKVLLTGQRGNVSISYTGAPYLPSLFGKGHWVRWWQEIKGLRRQEPRPPWRRLLLRSVGPFCPPPIWRQINRLRGQGGQELTEYSAISPEFMQRSDHDARVRASGWDLSYRPWADGLRMRIAMLTRSDNGDYATATNTSGLEERDPTADRRLIELCLAIPDRQYLRNGQDRWLLRRLMADDLPPEILQAKTKGYQAADWYEAIGAKRGHMRDELNRLQAQGVGKYLDLESLVKSLDEWPDSGWEQEEVVDRYRLKLLRGLSVGTFVRMIKPNNQ